MMTVIFIVIYLKFETLAGIRLFFNDEMLTLTGVHMNLQTLQARISISLLKVQETIEILHGSAVQTKLTEEFHFGKKSLAALTTRRHRQKL
jgi:hypothetical protein